MYRILLYAFVLFAVVSAQDVGAGTLHPAPLMELQARRMGKSLYLPVSINSKPFWFAVDSGAYQSVVDASVVQKAGLKVTGEGTVLGTGKGKVPVKHVAAVIMRLGGLPVPVPEPLLIDLSGTGNPAWMHGLIGAELFEKYVVQMDYDKNVFRIFQPERFAKPPDAAEIPVIAENHRFYLEAVLEVADKETVTHRLRIDTGSEDSIDDAVVKDGTNVRQTTLGNGLGGNYQGYSGIFKAVHLGPFTFRNVWGPGAPNSGIGMEMFRRFIVTFDIPHRKLYLEPNQEFNDAFPPPPGQ